MLLPRLMVISICLALVTLAILPNKANAFDYPPYTLVEVEMECGKDTKGKNGYTSRFMGLVNEGGVAFMKSWASRNSNQQQMVSGTGMIKSNKKLVIKGKGELEKTEKKWNYFFSVDSSGSIITDLENGIPGKEVTDKTQRKCDVRLIKKVKASLAFDGSSLMKRNLELANQSDSFASKISDLQVQIKELEANSGSVASVDEAELTAKIKSLEEENLRVKAELDAANLAKATAESRPSVEDGEREALRKEVAALEIKLAKATADLESASRPSAELLNMAAAISDLQGRLQESETQLTQVQQDSAETIAVLEGELDESKSLSKTLQAEIAKNDEDLKNLQVALRAMQSLASTEPAECEPAMAQPTADDLNNPVIAYLEAKTKDLEKRLEACAAPVASTEPGKLPTDRPIAQSYSLGELPEAIKGRQWFFDDDIKSSGLSCAEVKSKTNGILMLTEYFTDKQVVSFVPAPTDEFNLGTETTVLPGSNGASRTEHPLQLLTTWQLNGVTQKIKWEYNAEDQSLNSVAYIECKGCTGGQKLAWEELATTDQRLVWCNGQP